MQPNDNAKDDTTPNEKLEYVLDQMGFELGVVQYCSGIPKTVVLHKVGPEDKVAWERARHFVLLVNVILIICGSFNAFDNPHAVNTGTRFSGYFLGTAKVSGDIVVSVPTWLSSFIIMIATSTVISNLTHVAFYVISPSKPQVSAWMTVDPTYPLFNMDLKNFSADKSILNTIILPMILAANWMANYLSNLFNGLLTKFFLDSQNVVSKNGNISIYIFGINGFAIVVACIIISLILSFGLTEYRTNLLKAAINSLGTFPDKQPPYLLWTSFEQCVVLHGNILKREFLPLKSNKSKISSEDLQKIKQVL